MYRPLIANCLTVVAPHRCCCLNMYTGIRDRGQAMVDLMAQYEQHGLQLDSRELPDHLPLYLEYLAQLPKSEALGVYRISRRFWRCSAHVCNSVTAVMRCCSICC